MKTSLKHLSICTAIALSFNPFNLLLADDIPKAEKKAKDKTHRVDNYDKNAMGINAPMYDYYANKIKETTNITQGVCLDVGSGGGYMGLALSKITDLDFIFLDISKEALKKADQHIKEYHLEKKAKTLLANVESIPLEDNSIDLVISRGSIPFWEHPEKGLAEIYRVLKVGGKAYVGGGKGSPEIRAAIDKKLQEMGKEPRMNKHKVHGDGMKRDYAQLLQSVEIKNFKIHQGDDGKWIEMWK
ncbi:class I SAM-dependent methyltransferase [Sulfurimonas sp.]|uniref:class I SAM-dependent methyltransferase n=1 Tax=Sulfurimonas sp. TaxID=2022749 RepID=UPI003D1384EC